MPQRELEAPDGTIGVFDDNDPAVIKAWVLKHTPSAVPPSKDAPSTLAKPGGPDFWNGPRIESNTPKDQGMRAVEAMANRLQGGSPAETRRRAQDPKVAAMVAASLVPGAGIPMALLRAGAAGTAAGGASHLRGDQDPVRTGLTEGAYQLGGDAVWGTGLAAARGMMGTSVPASVTAAHPDVDIPQALLDKFIIPGTKWAKNRAARMGPPATAAVGHFARTAPSMSPVKRVEGLRPIYDTQAAAGRPELAQEVMDYATANMRQPLSGPAQVARQGSLTQYPPRGGVLAGDLGEAEAQAITGHMRQTPALAGALDEKKAVEAIADVANAPENKAGALSRLTAPNGGFWSTFRAPMVMGGAANIVNQASRLADPNLRRVLMQLLQGQSRRTSDIELPEEP